VPIATFLPLAFLLLCAVLSDLRTRTIPNELILIGVFYGLTTTSFAWSGLSFIQMTLGFLVGLALFFYPYSKSWIGAGDLKLMAMIGMYLGPYATLMAGLYATAVGGFLAIGYVIQRNKLKKTITNIFDPKEQQESMPYALAIAIGTLISISQIK
jgi:prepilin peptidase CpaA